MESVSIQLFSLRLLNAMRFPSARSAGMKIIIKDYVERNFGEDEIVSSHRKVYHGDGEKIRGYVQGPGGGSLDGGNHWR